MVFETEFVEIPLDQLHQEAAVMKADGWRFIQTHAVNADTGIDLYYSFMKEGLAKNLKVTGVTKDQPVPSITDLFLAAFVFENEARELFGVDMHDIALDFQGAMYAPAVNEPMTFITPEQKAAREKAAKAAEAKETGQDGVSRQSADKPKTRRIFIMTPERRARLDAKLATMSPEKVAKVEAALKARAAEAEAANAAAEASSADPGAKPETANAAAEASSAKTEAKPVDNDAAAPASAPEPRKDVQLEEKLSKMDPEKAARVRAALARKGGNAPDGSASEAGGREPVGQEQAALAPAKLDSELEAKLSIMAPEKAAKARAAILDKAARDAACKGGE